MLKKIISGGQTGVDIAALRAAKSVGLETGGFIPKGFRTEGGQRPEYAEMYGLMETNSRDYPARTRANVEAADVTLFIGRRSPGFFATFKAAEDMGKPIYLVEMNDIIDAETHSLSLRGITNCVQYHNNPVTFNVAGNRNANEQSVEKWLTKLFNMLLEVSKETP